MVFIVDSMRNRGLWILCHVEMCLGVAELKQKISQISRGARPALEMEYVELWIFCHSPVAMSL